MNSVKPKKHLQQNARRTDNNEGIDFVRCKICGGHRRVISGRHLSKHGIDRETYMEEYRLSPDKLIAKDFRMIQSSRRDYHPYGKSDWIAAMKNVYKRDGQVFAGYLQDNYPNLHSQGTWLFGDWDKALRAAGFEPENARMWGFWDQEKLIRQIRGMRKKNLPLNAKYAMKNHQKLFSAAVRQCGSWSKALFAAGIKIPSYAHGGRLGILRALHDLDGHSKNDVPQPLTSCAVYYFGSLQKAMVAAKSEPRIVSAWSKAKITTILSRMHIAKQTLSYITARRYHRPLVNAAEKHFGSWGKALYAAGIDPNLYYVHHKWRKSKLRDKR